MFSSNRHSVKLKRSIFSDFYVCFPGAKQLKFWNYEVWLNMLLLFMNVSVYVLKFIRSVSTNYIFFPHIFYFHFLNKVEAWLDYQNILSLIHQKTTKQIPTCLWFKHLVSLKILSTAEIRNELNCMCKMD